jgi:hypothetical protein
MPAVAPERLAEMERALARRVVALEKEQQRLHARIFRLQAGGSVAIALLALTSAAALSRTGPKGEDVLQARRIEIRHADTVRAVIGMTGEGAPGLFLKDRRGVTRLRVELRPDGTPGMTFWNAQGEQRLVELAAFSDSAHLVLAGAGGQRGAIVHSNAEGAGYLFAASHAAPVALPEPRAGADVSAGSAAAAPARVPATGP